LKFTIYTGFYNTPQLIDKVWALIQAQTYTNWEWFVVDDMSPNPEVTKRLEKLAASDSRIKFFKPRWKREYFWNPPVEEATGDVLVTFCDDDLPHPKLLEIYKYNYEKFPKVEMITSNMIFRKNSTEGDFCWHGFRYINVGDSLNFTELLDKANVSGVLGHGVSYRIRKNKPNEFVEEGVFKHFIAEDEVKPLTIQERGKLLYLPRVLYYYAVEGAESASNDHFSKIQADPEVQTKAINEYQEWRKTLKSSKELGDRFERYYDVAYKHTIPFYFAEFINGDQEASINYFTSKIDKWDKEKLRDLYYDYDLYFNDSEKVTNYTLFGIYGEEDLQLLKECSGFSNKVTVMVKGEELFKSTCDFLSNMVPYCYYKGWGDYYYITINQKWQLRDE